MGGRGKRMTNCVPQENTEGERKTYSDPTPPTHILSPLTLLFNKATDVTTHTAKFIITRDSSHSLQCGGGIKEESLPGHFCFLFLSSLQNMAVRGSLGRMRQGQRHDKGTDLCWLCSIICGILFRFSPVLVTFSSFGHLMILEHCSCSPQARTGVGHCFP